MKSRGTLSDKISALSLLIQRDPARSISYLDQLMAIASKKSRKQAEMSVGALRDLFCQYLLTKEFKVIPF